MYYISSKEPPTNKVSVKPIYVFFNANKSLLVNNRQQTIAPETLYILEVAHQLYVHRHVVLETI